MWIFTRYGFYSVACGSEVDPETASVPNTVMIRARSRAHLDNLQKRFKELSEYSVLEWPDRDYRFRLIVGKDKWTSIIAELAGEQTWSNFKNEVANSLSGDHDYIHALHQVWSVMRKLQDESVAVPAP